VYYLVHLVLSTSSRDFELPNTQQNVYTSRTLDVAAYSEHTLVACVSLPVIMVVAKVLSRDPKQQEIIDILLETERLTGLKTGTWIEALQATWTRKKHVQRGGRGRGKHEDDVNKIH
jgi:hypothetical protein